MALCIFLLGTIPSQALDPVYISGSQGGVLTYPDNDVYILSDINVDDTGYFLLYAATITFSNNAGITAFGKGFGGGGGGGGENNSKQLGAGYGGGVGSITNAGSPGMNSAGQTGGDGGRGGGSAAYEQGSWQPQDGQSSETNLYGGAGGSGGGPYGGTGGGSGKGAVGGNGNPGGYNATGTNNETSIGAFFPDVPSTYTNYSIYRGSGSGGGGGGGQKGAGKGQDGGCGGAAGGTGDAGGGSSGGGGGGAAGGGAIVLRAFSGTLNMTNAGTINAAGAKGAAGGGTNGAGGGVVLIGNSIILGSSTVITNLGGGSRTNGGSLKIWYHAAGSLSTNNAKFYCGKIFTNSYGPIINNDSGASNITCTSAVLNGIVVLTNNFATTVHAFWGEADADIYSNNWDNPVNLGVLNTGLFSTTIGGLLANKKYYYRMYAENSASYHWAAATTNFTTPKPTLQFDTTNASGAESVADVYLGLTLSATSAVAVTANYTVVSVTATGGGVDYTLTNGLVTITAGSVTTNLAFTIEEDLLDEYDETFRIILSNAVNATFVAAYTNHTYTILDNDAPPVIGYSGAPYAVVENATSRTVSVSLSTASAKTTSVNYATAAGTATAGTDYTNASGTLTWNPGDTTTKTFAVFIVNDGTEETNETILVTISNTVNSTLHATSNTVITIIDDDGNPMVFFVDDPYTIGEGGVYATVSVMRVGASASAVTVDYATTNGTATVDNDFTNTTGTLTWGAAEYGTKTFTIPIINDTMDEYDETVSIRLTNASNATISGNNPALVTIADNDPPTAVIWSGCPCTVDEGAEIATVTVLVSQVSAKDGTVRYIASSGSATAGDDFHSVTGVLAWAAGETGPKSFTITVMNDAYNDEDDETITLTLDSETNLTISGSNPTTVTIVDDDPPHELSLVGNPYTVGEDITNATVSVKINLAAGRDLSLNYSLYQGTATAGVDYTNVSGTLTWLKGESQTNSFAVPIIDDIYGEPSETINVALSIPTNAIIIGDTNTTITITDNDPLEVNNYLGASGISASNATLRGNVERTAGYNPTVRFYWGTNDAGTNRTGWGRTNTFPTAVGAGVFSSNMTALVSNRTYYYRAYATNTAGEAWAPITESFVALDPPFQSIIDNGSMELTNTVAADARNWTRSDSSKQFRTNALPRTLTFSMQFRPAKPTLYGSASNAFKVAWNGQQADGTAITNGGVRPGFKLSGRAYTRAEVGGKDPVKFTYRWWNVTDAYADFSDDLTHKTNVYQEIAISNTVPVPAADVGDQFRPELKRETDFGSSGTATNFYADDVDIFASMPRLWLELNPTSPVVFPTTIIGANTDTNLGARNQGGGEGTVLYGAYITNAADLISGAWSNNAWCEVNDPSNAFEIVSGATLATTNQAGYQYVTLRFSPPGEGMYTGTIRVATTDPTDRYTGGGALTNGILYEEYLLTGTGRTAIQFASSNVTVLESVTAVSLPLLLSAASVLTCRVDYAVSGGTATGGGVDYTLTNGTIVVPPGDTTAYLNFTVINDTVQEFTDETITLYLTNEVNVFIWTNRTFTYTIQDDDADQDGDQLADYWENLYFGGLSQTGTPDADGDGVNNKFECWAGTDPTDIGKYLRIASADLTNSGDMRIDCVLGTDARLNKLLSSETATGTFAAVVQSEQLTGNQALVHTNAVNTTSTGSRFYQISVTFNTHSYTNPQQYAMFVDQRVASNLYMVSAPFDVGANNNLSNTLGRQLGRGLYAGTNQTDSDILYYRTSNNAWKLYYWVTNGTGQSLWWDYDAGARADLTLTPGMGFWIQRRIGEPRARTNCVLAGLALTNASPLYFRTNEAAAGWSWILFGWPFAAPKWQYNYGIGATPSNQLGMESVAYGGTTADNARPFEEKGDQIWVWESNTFKNSYWLMRGVGPAYDGRWWDNRVNSFGTFKLEAGKAYLYRHHVGTNGGTTGTNFWWTPTP